mmetsp:Transcript_4737/g.12150  ORF Transcript_4737/g.12150 Transcript_4737/m.12150 type:complete len:94 (+) Transcript_4737:408-689(+)
MRQNPYTPASRLKADTRLSTRTTVVTAFQRWQVASRLIFVDSVSILEADTRLSTRKVFLHRWKTAKVLSSACYSFGGRDRMDALDRLITILLE